VPGPKRKPSSVRVKPKQSGRTDPLSPRERSERMARVRSRGNRSTEQAVRGSLRRCGVTGWRSHPPSLFGKPDFFFPKERVAVFVDGCFWHACPHCKRRMPRQRRGFWKAKLQNNVARARIVNETLNKQGIRVLRVWEHELREDAWTGRVIHEVARQRYRTSKSGG
jgi:DNA mismatch endonuclease (patch repair protein)